MAKHGHLSTEVIEDAYVQLTCICNFKTQRRGNSDKKALKELRVHMNDMWEQAEKIRQQARDSAADIAFPPGAAIGKGRLSVPFGRFSPNCGRPLLEDDE